MCEVSMVVSGREIKMWATGGGGVVVYRLLFFCIKGFKLCIVRVFILLLLL